MARAHRFLVRRLPCLFGENRVHEILKQGTWRTVNNGGIDLRGSNRQGFPASVHEKLRLSQLRTKFCGAFLATIVLSLEGRMSQGERGCNVIAKIFSIAGRFLMFALSAAAQIKEQTLHYRSKRIQLN